MGFLIILGFVHPLKTTPLYFNIIKMLKSIAAMFLAKKKSICKVHKIYIEYIRTSVILRA